MKLRVALLILMVLVSGCLGSSSSPPIEPEKAEFQDFEKSVQNISEYDSYTLSSSISISGGVVLTDGIIGLKIDNDEEIYRLDYFLFEEEFLQYYENGKLYSSLVNPKTKSNSSINTTFSEIKYKPENFKDIPLKLKSVEVEKKESKDEILYEYNVSYTSEEDIKVPPEYKSLKSGNMNITLSENGDFRSASLEQELPNNGTVEARVSVQQINSTNIEEPDWVEEIR